LLKSKVKPYSYLKNIGIALLISAVVLLIISLILRLRPIQEWYDRYAGILYSLEMAVASIENLFIFIITILLIFALKSIIPIIPFSAVCLVSGIILPPQQSIIVNILGTSLWLLFKYLWGYTLGPGYITKFLQKYSKIKEILESKGNGNPWLLFAFRVIPYFPLNTVSQLYGSLQFKVIPYLLISLLGLLPRIITYAFVGGNLFDPFSFSFYLPIILFLSFTGASALILSYALKKASKLIPRKDDKNVWQF